VPKRKSLNCPNVLTLAVILGIGLPVACMAAPADNDRDGHGKAAFQQMCASCHLGGGNLVKPEKPVRGSGKLSTLAVFKQYMNAPLGHMPYYAHVTKDPAVLRSLYNYCRDLEKQPIKRISTNLESSR
jgi:hypothetical protein